MTAYLLFGLGLICAAVGGELFVRGLIGVARRSGVPASIIGATLAAFATSAPELSVGINSAVAGTPELSLGDTIGSNIVNVSLVLGLPLLIAGLAAPSDAVRRDLTFALLAPLLTAAFLFDGGLSRIEAAIMLLLFAAWLVTTGVEARRRRDATAATLDSGPLLPVAGRFFGGLALLFAAGQLIVAGALGVAEALGIDLYLVGALAIAVGTSAPEIATAVVAQIRRHGEITLGVILGSNIFNGLFVVPLATLIHPITAVFNEAAVGLGFGAAVTALVYPGAKGALTRRRGAVLILLWVAYILAQFRARGTT
ncbi:MAG: sodium:calcium antiporter [Rhodospirillales bacterium]|nr:sodium:calcium antiporter [Rhodospirillales bacterium]